MQPRNESERVQGEKGELRVQMVEVCTEGVEREPKQMRRTRVAWELPRGGLEQGCASPDHSGGPATSAAVKGPRVTIRRLVVTLVRAAPCFVGMAGLQG